MRKLVPFAVAVVAALTLAGCSDPTTTTPNNAGDSGNGSATTEKFDPLSIKEVPDIAAMVPDAIKKSGQLRNGASTDYAPAEFRDDKGNPIGYDIEIVQALGQVMGLEGTTQHAEFPTIIPALGSKFDIGASSFTINPDRLAQVNMVSYLTVGSAFAVKTGNPNKFDPKNPCGFSIGVQNGTYQMELAQQWSDKCVKDGKKAITVNPLDLQTDVTVKVVGGQWDATFADSPVIGYSVANANGALEQVGEDIETEPQGIAIAKDDQQLTVAIQAAVQYLMDQGYLKKILANYGSESIALTKAEINPGK